MGNLTRKDWSLGWRPDMDANNGTPQGLLRADNLHLDNDGVLSLAKGSKIVNDDPYSGAVENIYSYVNGATKVRYVATTNGQVVRSTDDTVVLINGGDHTAFGSAFGQVLMTSGQVFQKDDGQLVRELGISPPHLAPTITVYPRSKKVMDTDLSQWIIDEGTGTTTNLNGGNITYTPTSVNQRASVYRLFATPQDSTNTTTGAADKPENDIMRMDVRIGNTRILDYLEIIFYVTSPTATSDINGYSYTWKNVSTEDGPFIQGLDKWTALTARRGDFTRIGASSEDWTTIRGIRVTMVFNAPVAANANQTTISSNNILLCPEFQGGDKGKLNGYYDYCQVNVFNSGVYVGKSKAGPIAESEYVDHGYTKVTPVKPDNDKQPNEVWIFRRSRLPEESLRDYLVTGILDQFYRVLVIKSDNPDPAVAPTFTAADDTMSDAEAIQLDITLNIYLEAVKANGKEIIGMEGLFYDRMLYLTTDSILISDRLNPDSFDTRFVLKISGDKAEKYLWITKITNGILLLATTNEIYEIAGTLSELPDGTMDIAVRALGEAHPPLSRQYAKTEGKIFYASADGWRVTGGSNSELLSPTLRHLWQGEVRHGYPFTVIYPNASGNYPCTVSHNKFWGCSGPDIHIYDFIHKAWYVWNVHPTVLTTELDGTILGGFGGNDGNNLRELWTGTQIDETEGQAILFQTIYDDDGLPRNRKDVFTFKVVLDTGGEDVSISIAKAGSPQYSTIGTFSSNGKGERFITIAETIGLSKSYSVKIEGSGLSTFKLYNFTIEYEPRPEQLTYIRIPYQNLGTQSRKRFVNFAFVIDTLGTDCEFFPLIDGVVAGAVSIVNFDRKGTHIHYFVPINDLADEYVGTDIGGIICGFFEFYGVNVDEIVSEKLPVPVKFLLIPANDYDVPNRKRHSSYKFQINTRGGNVQFTPRVDHQWMAPAIYNTNEKQTVEYFFTTDTTGIDIGGRLESLNNTPFEFYGVIRPQNIEILPPRLREFYIPENNYGIAARKRVRTMPMELYTGGQPVTFTPIVDRVRLAPSTFTTTSRQTVFHYFTTDVFGVDFSGELVATTSTPFEFNGLLKPEEVETLPVAKRFDQIGPARFDKLAKFQSLRIRAIFGDVLVPIKIINEVEATLPASTGSIGEWTTTLNASLNKDDVYEISVPKTVNGTIFRIEIGPTVEPFHRYDVQIKLVTGGMEATPKWIKVQ